LYLPVARGEGLIVAILNRAVKNARAILRAQEWGDSSIPPNSMPFGFRGPASSSGEAGALAIGTVLACVKALYDDTNILPFRAYQGDPRGARQQSRVQPLIVAEPFGPDVDPQDGVSQLVVSKAMRGNAYGLIVGRDADNPEYPSQLMVAHPDAVKCRRDPGTNLRYYVIGGQRVEASDIVHVRGFTLPGQDVGVDILTYERTTFDLAWSVNQYADGFFGNGGSPSGVISVPGQGDRKRAREVREAFEQAHSGVTNAHRPAVMFGGATWTQLTVSPENAQFLQTRRYLREEICGLFGVPMQRVQAIVENASQGGGKGIDAFDAQYIKHGIMPAVGPLERAWTRMIPGGAGTWVAFDYDEFLRASAEVRSAVALQHRTAGIRTKNEIRATDYYLPPLPADQDGDDANAPLNSSSPSTGGADNAPAPGNTDPGGTS
jgi:HK97 family phage portal protein